MQLFHFHHCKRHLKKRTIALDPLPPPPAYAVYARENDDNYGRPLSGYVKNIMLSAQKTAPGDIRSAAIHGGGGVGVVAEWVTALSCTGDRTMRDGFESHCTSELWQFRLPNLPVSFGEDTKSRRSLLSGVYARGSKRSHQSTLECVTVVDSTTHSPHPDCVYAAENAALHLYLKKKKMVDRMCLGPCSHCYSGTVIRRT